MPTTTILNTTFDGINDAARLDGATTSFDSGFMGYYSVYDSKANDVLRANVSLTGSDWTVATMRFGAAFRNKTFIEDLDAGTGRRIDLLSLGYNSDVDLISTRVRTIYGWDGDKHDVTLGNQQNGSTYSINLNAKENILTTGNAWVGAIDTGYYGTGTAVGDTITIGSGGAGSVFTANANDKITTTSGFVATIRTRDGNDQVTTGTGWVESISVGDGKDVVKMGTGGAGQVLLGDGNDKIYLSEMNPDFGLDFRGQSGTDTVFFSGFTSGVTFSLDNTGFQNVSNPNNKPNVANKGWFRQSNTENAVGTGKGDQLTGNGGDNKLTGRGGVDTLNGGGGNDTLKGDGGNDKLNGDAGRDTLIGGAGKDKLNGGEGNDILRGKAGADVFIFAENSGTDTVKDYSKSADILRLVGHTGGFSDLTIGFSQQLGGTTIDHDNGTIILEGFNGNLTANQFDFV